MDESCLGDDEDIEDLGDIVPLINISTEYVAKNKNLNDKKVCDLFDLRLYGKRKIKIEDSKFS
mgnify:CR=1 FL=1